MPKKNVIVGLVVLMGVLLLSAPFAVNAAFYAYKLKPSIKAHQERLRINARRFLRAQDRIVYLNFFKTGSASRDAGEILNNRAGWNGKKGPLSVGEGIRNSMKGWAEFPVGFETIDDSGFDFAWMKTLLEYDHWNWQNAPPAVTAVKRGLAGEEMRPFASFEPPDLSPFPALATLRLVRALKTGGQSEIGEAMKVTRHLARILYSMEETIGVVMAVVILRRQLQAANWLKANRPDKLPLQWFPDLPLPPKNVAKTIIAAEAFFGILTPPEVLDSIYSDRDVIGYCASLRHGTALFTQLAPLLLKRYPGERSYAVQYEKMKAIVLSSPCRLPGARKFWERSPEEWRKGTMKDTRTLASLPYFRQNLGLMAALVGVPSTSPE